MALTLTIQIRHRFRLHQDALYVQIVQDVALHQSHRTPSAIVVAAPGTYKLANL
jgi:hypothetical protein